MALRSLVEKLGKRWQRPTGQHRRFHPSQIALVILVAGWLPLLLTLLLTYSSLRKTLERRLIVDRRTLIDSVSSLIAYDLTRPGEVMQYYQTLPQIEGVIQLPPGDPRAQTWLESVYYGQPRIDGMFLADPSGRILAALPRDEAMIGTIYPRSSQIESARQIEGYFISPVHHRSPDNRKITAMVVALRGPAGELRGYIGAQVLIERIGRRLKEYDFGESSTAQLFDQNGVPLFQSDLQPREKLTPGAASLLEILREDQDGVFTYESDFFTSSEVDDTGWIALLRQPLKIAYAPLRTFVGKASLLALWMLAGTAVVAVGISRIYARQLAADERVQREMLFSEKVLSSMPIGVGVFDPQDRRMLKMNEHLSEMVKKFGACQSSGPGFDELGFTSPEMFDKTVRHNWPFVASEIEVEDREGEENFLSLTVFPIQGPRDRLQGVLLVAVDTTSESSVRRQLKAANVAKDQFLASLSHELRNPLSPIVAMVDELEAQTGLDEEGRRALEVIRRNVSLEARLIDDLLDVTRIAHNKLQLSLAKVDAHSVIEDAVQVCRSEIVAKEVSIKIRLEAVRHRLQADGARLSQVFWNLIKNAVKFTPSGGVVSIRTWNEGDRFLAEVADTGGGIEPDRLKNIFERFEQGGTAVTRQFGGLGLGLAISKAMLDAHGAGIRAESEGLGKGARFTIIFEKALADEVTEPATQTVPDGPPRQTRGEGTSARILLVDDHTDTSSGMKRLLERRGYEVVTAENVADALKTAGSSSFDLLISDLGLPDGSGLELMKDLRRTHPEMPGIAISGFGMESDHANTREAGFSEHLIKPVDLERLTAAIAKLLG